MLLVRLLDGVGKALGSAILMACEPWRYSVIDVNAVRAIQALGYLRDCPTPTNRNRSLPDWVRYLAAVRDVASRTGWTLRDVDRALYHAGRQGTRENSLIASTRLRWSPRRSARGRQLDGTSIWPRMPSTTESLVRCGRA